MRFIKVRKRGEKRFLFLAPGGRETRLRIHAILFESDEKLQAALTKLQETHPDFEFKAVE